MQQIYRKHPCWSAISIKLQSNFIEITLRHGCSTVNLLHIFRTPFLKNTFGWLLLKKLLKIKYFQRGLSKQPFKSYLVFYFAPSPFFQQDYEKQKGSGSLSFKPDNFLWTGAWFVQVHNSFRKLIFYVKLKSFCLSFFEKSNTHRECETPISVRGLSC